MNKTLKLTQDELPSREDIERELTAMSVDIDEVIQDLIAISGSVAHQIRDSNTLKASIKALEERVHDLFD